MKNKLIVLLSMGMVLASAPMMALAQTAPGIGITGNSSYACALGSATGNLGGFLCRIGQLLNSIIPVLVALGVVYFVWGVVTYVISSDEEAKKSGKNRIIYGLIGLVVIIGMWGLVSIIRNTFSLDNNTNIQLPTIPVVLPPPGQ